MGQLVSHSPDVKSGTTFRQLASALVGLFPSLVETEGPQSVQGCCLRPQYDPNGTEHRLPCAEACPYEEPNNPPEHEECDRWSAEWELDVPTPTTPSKVIVIGIDGYHSGNLHGFRVRGWLGLVLLFCLLLLFTKFTLVEWMFDDCNVFSQLLAQRKHVVLAE